MSTSVRYTNTRPAVSTAEAMTLPAGYYTDPEMFQRELRAVHHDMWLSAGRTEQLPEAGSYFLVRFAGVNIIVVRDKNGEIAAFHNTCRHRGTQLCKEQSGKVAGKFVIIREELVGDTALTSRQGIELALGVLSRMATAVLGPNWHPVSVNFSHPAPPDLQVHRRVFHCSVHFDAEFNGIVCHAADLDRPNPNADPAMARYAKQFVESLPGASHTSITHEVRKAIYLMLPMGRANIEQIADGLGMHVRTLQRQLEAADTQFSDLVNEVRRELVVRYMENANYSLATISELLGYSMPSSFTRWFTTQFGAPPQQWRARKMPAGRRARTD